MELNTLIPYDLESYPLHFKTTSLVGSEDFIGIYLTTNSRTISYAHALVVWLYLSRPPVAKISGCTGWIRLNTSLG